jgi:hypothetical protein
MSDDPDDKLSPEELARREAWFNEYTERLDSQPPQLPLRCPCCRCKSLTKRGEFEVCPICYWEDDGQDDHDADVIRGGPNRRLSLTQARANYRLFYACEKRHVPNVRAALPDELPDDESA